MVLFNLKAHQLGVYVILNVLWLLDFASLHLIADIQKAYPKVFVISLEALRAS
jgi:hypothetical protein